MYSTLTSMFVNVVMALPTFASVIAVLTSHGAKLAPSASSVCAPAAGVTPVWTMALRVSAAMVTTHSWTAAAACVAAMFTDVAAVAAPPMAMNWAQNSCHLTPGSAGRQRLSCVQLCEGVAGAERLGHAELDQRRL
jgi:hypothetical protein